MISREGKQIIWLEEDEARKLVNSMYALHGEYWGDMAEIQLGMGWRPEELSILQKKFVTETTLGLEPVPDPENNHIWGKTGSRSVRFPTKTREAVNRRLVADDSLLLFPRHLKKDESYSQLSLIEQKWQATGFDYAYRSRLKKAAKAAGLTKPIVCRILRTTFGSLMIRAKRTPYEVAKVMGDRVKTIEKHYARLLAEEINTELDPIPVRQS